MRTLDIKDLLTMGLETYMRSYLLQLHNITGNGIDNETDINEDKGYQIRDIVMKAEDDIRRLGVGRSILAPEIQETEGFDAFYLWKVFRGEDVTGLEAKQKIEIDEESIRQTISLLQNLIVEDDKKR